MNFKEYLDEKKLSYNDFVGIGKEMWDVTFSYGAGRGGQRTSMRSMVGLPVGSKEADVKKAWNKNNKGKKFISAKFKGIRESLDEKLSLVGDVFDVVMLGGSIGEKPIRSLSQLKGQDVISREIFVDKEEAKAYAKRRNKMLSPGEKKYYRIKYVVAAVSNGKYTGK